MKPFIQFLFLMFSFFIVPAAFSQYDWKLTKSGEGISVYQSTVRNSAYKTIKVECTLDGSFDKLLAVIRNVNGYTDWVYSNKTASLLVKPNPSEFYYYSETSLPWPMSNRDAVMHTVIIRDSLNRFLRIHSTSDEGLVAEKPDKVRVSYTDINWYVTMPSQNSIHVVYTFEANPGGSIPAWMVNSFADKGPFETFKKLGELLKQQD